jgi:hypothetical protein
MRYAIWLLLSTVFLSVASASQDLPTPEQLADAFQRIRAAVPDARITYTRSMHAAGDDVEIHERDEGSLLLSPHDFALRVSPTEGDGKKATRPEAVWILIRNRLISVDTGRLVDDPRYDLGAMLSSPKAHLASSDCILNVWLYRRGMPLDGFIRGALDRNNISLSVSHSPPPRDHLIMLRMRVENQTGELVTLAEMVIDPHRGMLVEAQRTWRVVGAEPIEPPLTEVEVKDARQLGDSGVWFPTLIEMRADRAVSRFVVAQMQVGEGEFRNGLLEILDRPVIVRGLDHEGLYLLDRAGRLIKEGSENDDAAARMMLEEYLESASD